jgi:hypothetical protein
MRRESGEVSAQTVIAIPVVFMFLMLAVQATVYVHAAHVAAVAATNGASAGAAVGGTDVAALAEATRTIAELSGRAHTLPSFVRGEGSVEVTVRLAVPRVAPFFDLTVTRSARDRIERYVPETER